MNRFLISYHGRQTNISVLSSVTNVHSIIFLKCYCNSIFYLILTLSNKLTSIQLLGTSPTLPFSSASYQFGSSCLITLTTSPLLKDNSLMHKTTANTPRRNYVFTITIYTEETVHKSCYIKVARVSITLWQQQCSYECFKNVKMITFDSRGRQKMKLGQNDRERRQILTAANVTQSRGRRGNLMPKTGNV